MWVDINRESDGVWGSVFISGTTWRQGGRSRVLRRHEACEIGCIDVEGVPAKR